jgi:hypothetical protein
VRQRYSHALACTASTFSTPLDWAALRKPPATWQALHAEYCRVDDDAAYVRAEHN